MHKYKFTKTCDWWEEDHHNNFALIKSYFGSSYGLIKQGAADHLSFLEIGVFEGRTSVWLLDNILQTVVLNRKPGILHCIDPNLTKNGRHNLAQHIGDVILYDEPSQRVLVRLIQEDTFKFDFIYVDGDHNACCLLEDILLSWKLLRVGGIMLIDDYEMETTDRWHYRSHPEFGKEHPRLRFTHPRIAIDAFLAIYRGQYELIINNYQIGVVKLLNFPQ